MSRKPQFRDNVFNIIKRQKIKPIQSVCLVIYYFVAKNIPLGNKLRSLLGRKIFKKVGKDVTILKGVDFGSGLNIVIGDYSSLNKGCWIANDTIIGDDVMMGPEIIILSGSHNFDRTDIPMREQGAPPRRPVTIGDDVWIGTRSIILPGVSIGSHTIVGSGSVVTKDLPEWAIVAGNPARIIRYRK
jgi:maltose O-acetyltransferase